jgi:hypothetical protein
MIISGLQTIKPTQEPQVKNGEQPGHSFSLAGDLSDNSFFVTILPLQSLSEQHGLVERTIT